MTWQSLPKATNSVPGSRCITFSQRRMAGHRLEEVVDRSTVGNDRLPYVYQLCRGLPNDVRTQQFPSLDIEKQLQEAGSVTLDHTAHILLIASFAYFIGNAFLGQL